MKSRTSFFNLTVLRKNITRFAPAWALYGVVLVMFMLLLTDLDRGIRYADSMIYTIPPFAVINFFYALLCGQLLFGDLYNSRMCNALHAMPLRREGWFLTNIVSGLLFSLIPNLVITLISLPLVGGLVSVPLLWLAAVTLQYLFFFGTAVLSAYCVGNRFAMALVYIILNGFSLILFWLTTSIYEPYLYGVQIQADIFYTFCPVVKMAGNFRYIGLSYTYSYGNVYNFSMEMDDGWGYLGVCAALGIGCMILALAAYRRRNLESAGDFVAIRWLGPVFLVLYTLCGGACCHGFFALFLGDNGDIFLLLGFAIGFFTGLMLLHRTVRVFRKKTVLGFGAFLLAFFLSFLAAQTDALGITRWVPKAEQVKGVALTTGGSYYYNDYAHPLTDKEMIEDVLMIHRHAVENRDAGDNGEPDVRLFITYYMNDGTEHDREYYIDHDTDAGRCLRAYMSSPEVVLGEIYTQECDVIHISLPDPEYEVTDTKEIQSLLDAIVADSLAGDMGQDWNYMEEADYQFWLTVQYNTPEGMRGYREIRASSDCENILAWMEAHNIELEKYWK